MNKNSQHVLCETGPEPFLIDVKEVARLLGVSPRTVWRLSSTGELAQPVFIGRARRWPRKAIEDYVAGKAAGNCAGQPAVAARRDAV